MLDQAHITSLFENATEGIILTNRKGEIIMMNPASEKMFGYTREELMGHTVEILVPNQYKHAHHELREGFYDKPANRVMGQGRDLFGRRKNGTNMPLEVSLSHYEKDGELFVIAFIVDITLRKAIEADMLEQKAELEKITQRIRQLNAELEVKVEERTMILKEALQKLEESQQELHEALDKEKELNEIKSRFVSMASHEFRTPLTTVLSSASLLEKYTGAGDQAKRDKHIQRIRNSVNNLNDILEDFLSLGKLNEGRTGVSKQPADLKTIIGEVLTEMRQQLKPGQHFDLSFSGDEQVCTDKKLLRNILINLISNAIKFSGEDARIGISAGTTNKVAHIAVADEGIGIAADEQVHLFSSFFRAANAVNIQGTGLGLHIVKRYADLLSGDIKLSSELNKGTTVELIIPVNC